MPSVGPRASQPALLLFACSLMVACAQVAKTPVTTTASSLRLSRVVLYQNGVAYFERSGTVTSDALRIRVRKDQVNDLLKSLTVINRSSGKTVSVSMPLDPVDLGRAAQAALSTDAGNLPEVLKGLRGIAVEVETPSTVASGRVLMVEPIASVPPFETRGLSDGRRIGVPQVVDHELTLIDGADMAKVRLSEVERLRIFDGDVVMQMHRRLDAAAGEGLFQQVELSLRLAGTQPHDLVVSYVAEAPRWKPTYRLVLDPDGDALLQAWAVVDNLSGESWDDVALSLTAGAPLAFRYNLHAPIHVPRPDMTQHASRRLARVTAGESAGPALREPAPPPAPVATGPMAAQRQRVASRMSKKLAERADADEEMEEQSDDTPLSLLDEEWAPGSYGVDADAMEGGMAPEVGSKRVSGLTRFDLKNPVSVPDGTATMVALINERVQGEETFLFRPGGSGRGFERNPYRVARFQNQTPFALEPGPISVYAGGSFVGEGLTDAVAAGASAVIPFAVEPGIVVQRRDDERDVEQRLLRVDRGVFHFETRRRYRTVWKVSGVAKEADYRVLIRHPRRGGAFELVDPPAGTEVVPDAYLLPVVVPAGSANAEVSVVEATPRRVAMGLWDGRLTGFFELVLAGNALTDEQRQALTPIFERRREVGRIDTELDGLRRQQVELDRRADQTRQSLEALKKDPKATSLRARLSKRLAEFLAEGDAIGRRRVDLESKRLELRIELQDAVQSLRL